MAKTVSRSGDNGQSTPVPVSTEEGYFVEHKADPADLSQARVTSSATFKGMQDIETGGWIENLMASATNFSSPKGSFKLKPNGFHGSVQTIDENLRRDPYVLRAVQRGKIRFLSDQEAAERINELVDEDQTSGSHLDHLMESLGSNASENNGMYKIPLPDEAEPKGPSQTPEQIWANSTNKPESPKNFKQHVKSGESEFTL
jgi:hypothetical protein